MARKRKPAQNSEVPFRTTRFEDPAMKVREALSYASLSRPSLAAALGQSYNGQRDLYDALGWKDSLEFSDYLGKFLRDGVSKRVVCAFPDATWRGKPIIFDTDDPDWSEFEKKWNDLCRLQKVYHYLRRADRLAGIGRYSVMLLGFNDGKGLETPLAEGSATELSYIQPYKEDNANIKNIINNTQNEYYGKPEFYHLKVTDRAEAPKIIVHHSRVIHIAEDTLESETFGTPRLESVYNIIQTLELVWGGAGEMYWRGAYPGIGWMLDPEIQLTNTQIEQMDEAIRDFMHNLRRDVQLQGVTPHEFKPQAVSPKEHVQVLLWLISAGTGIPVRILTGSERGELSSIQDEANWNDRVMERREDFAEPCILRPFIDRLIYAGVLPQPQDEQYMVEWPVIDALNENEQATIALIYARALGEYYRSGAYEIMEPQVFLEEIMHWPQEQIVKALEYIDEKEQERMEREEKELEMAMKDWDRNANSPQATPGGSRKRDYQKQ